MDRRTLGLWIGMVFLVVLVAALVLFLIQVFEARTRPERQASTAARGTPGAVPTSPVPSMGTGAVVIGPWYELRFTSPTYPDDPARHRGGLDQRLVDLIDAATQSVDVAIYDFDLLNVAEALARASGRGAQVRMVTDTDTVMNTRDAAVQAALGRVRQANIPIVDDQRQDIMHHKFTIVDREWLETGSWNYTDGDTYRLNNNQFVVRSPELAANYTAEFEKMFVQRRFGPSKGRGVPNRRVEIEGAWVETYFAPQDEVARSIVDTINRQAKRSLEFMAFSFTSDPIGEAMMNRARAGVDVQGVFETTGSNTPFSEYGKMKVAGLAVSQDGNPWVMHHKVIVLDERIVMFGSYNFSSNADESNDENLLLVEDASLAQAFKAEYGRVLALAQNPPVRMR